MSQRVWCVSVWAGWSSQRRPLLSNPSLIVLHYGYQSAGRHTAPGLASFMVLLAEIFSVFPIFRDNYSFGLFFFSISCDAIGVTASPASSSWFRFIQSEGDECVSYAPQSEIKPDVSTVLIDESVGVDSSLCGDGNIHLCLRENVTHFSPVCQPALCPSHMDQMDCFIR